MATITEDYVSFEVAKLLKEKGFDEPCYMAYVPTHRKHIMRNDAGHSNSMHPDDYYAVPTLQMAMKWLREVHNVNIEPEPIWNGKKWEYQLFIVTPQNANSPYYENNPYKTYEECAEAAIKYYLENFIK